MNFLGKLAGWSAVTLSGLLLSAAADIQADPTDDFSFTLSHAPQLEAYQLMPVKRVAEIFEDRLDLFPKSQIPKLARHLMDLCQRYRFDPAFILSLIEVESSFRVKVVSPAGAIGLMQVMPATAEVLTRVGDWPGLTYRGAQSLMDPFTNLSLGTAYLSWLRDRYRHLNPYYLVAAYNAGPGRIDSLLSRKDFKPVKTKEYYEAIRKGVPKIRFYRTGEKISFLGKLDV